MYLLLACCLGVDRVPALRQFSRKEIFDESIANTFAYDFADDDQ
jgi:hypothetical protein